MKALRWLRINLFNNWYNSILTVVGVYAILRGLVAVFNWAVLKAQINAEDYQQCAQGDGACWAMVVDMWQLFMVGTYTFSERWRPYVLGITLIILIVLCTFPRIRSWKWFHLTWVVWSVLAFILLHGNMFGLKLVETDLWGGLTLTTVLALTGIILAFPVGIVLALGRRANNLPLIKTASIVYIELIRSVPLITVLFMASFMLPLFFSGGFDLDKVLRAIIGITMFSAAYIAETVRGGLQSIPRGQYEAAQSLGMSYWLSTTFIIMPQALKTVIPTLVGTAIGLFKDTSLVGIIGLFDLLNMVSLVSTNDRWLGVATEGYVFVGAIYWTICYSMSRFSKSLEKKYDRSR